MDLSLNGTGTTPIEYIEPKLYVMPLYAQLTWITLFMIIALVGSIGNITVIWIVLAHKNMHTVANLFIVNLALADALASLFNVTFSSYGEIFINWPFGGFYCKFNEGIASVSVCVSVITLAVLSIERYNVIITPFKPRMKRRTAILIITFIWSGSLLVTIPHWYFVGMNRMIYDGEEITLCLFQWDEIRSGERLRSLYSGFFMIITYFLPLACMAFTYGHVSVNLWGAHVIGEETEVQRKQKRAKQKIVQMMIVVVIMFAVCWFPMHLYFIIMDSKLNDSGLVHNFYLALFWLAMSNSMYNPIIYCWMNDKFRAGFKEAFQCCPCVPRQETKCSKSEIKNIKDICIK